MKHENMNSETSTQKQIVQKLAQQETSKPQTVKCLRETTSIGFINENLRLEKY